MERHDLPRSKLSTLVKIADAERIHFGITADISQTGISCLLSSALSNSSGPFLVSFRLNIKDKPITLPAVLVWSEPTDDGRMRVGLSFEELSDQTREQINDYVTADWARRHTGL